MRARVDHRWVRGRRRCYSLYVQSAGCRLHRQRQRRRAGVSSIHGGEQSQRGANGKPLWEWRWRLCCGGIDCMQKRNGKDSCGVQVLGTATHDTLSSQISDASHDSSSGGVETSQTRLAGPPSADCAVLPHSDATQSQSRACNGSMRRRGGPRTTTRRRHAARTHNLSHTSSHALADAPHGATTRTRRAFAPHAHRPAALHG